MTDVSTTTTDAPDLESFRAAGRGRLAENMERRGAARPRTTTSTTTRPK